MRALGRAARQVEMKLVLLQQLLGSSIIMMITDRPPHSKALEKRCRAGRAGAPCCRHTHSMHTRHTCRRRWRPVGCVWGGAAAGTLLMCSKQKQQEGCVGGVGGGLSTPAHFHNKQEKGTGCFYARQQQQQKKDRHDGTATRFKQETPSALDPSLVCSPHLSVNAAPPPSAVLRTMRGVGEAIA